MLKCQSPRSLVFGIRNLLWFLVRSEYAISRLTPLLRRVRCLQCLLIVDKASGDGWTTT